MKLGIAQAAKLASAALPTRIILSKAPKAAQYRRCTFELKGGAYHISRYSEKQAFHQNIAADELERALAAELSSRTYRQANAFAADGEHIIMLNKGYDEATYMLKPLSSTAPKPPEQTHNRKKQYILSEDEPIPALIDMGIFTKDGRIAAPMRDKFVQINRFLEIVRDAINEDGYLERKNAEPLRIIDFGCGKSYLTFVLYHYLVNILGIRVNMTGLDLKADVIAKCSAPWYINVRLTSFMLEQNAIYPMNIISLTSPSVRLFHTPATLAALPNMSELMPSGSMKNSPTLSATANITAIPITMLSTDLPSFSLSHFSNLVGSSSISSPASFALSVNVFMPVVSDSMNVTTPLIMGRPQNVPFCALVVQLS